MRIGESIHMTDYGRGWVTAVANEKVGIRLDSGVWILLPKAWLARRELAALLEPLSGAEEDAIVGGDIFVNAEVATPPKRLGTAVAPFSLFPAPNSSW